MSTIAEEIQRLQTAKSDIRTAIINKGVAVSDDVLIDEYAGKINSIPTNVETVVTKSELQPDTKFGYSTFSTFRLNDYTYQPYTDMSNMFFSCDNLQSLPDSGSWDTSNVINMSNMFSDCQSLTSVDISNWDVSNVTTMSSMFYGCSSLTSLDLSKWEISNLGITDSMFRGCSSLTSLDLTNWNLRVTDTASGLLRLGYMFDGCENLQEIKGINTMQVSPIWDGIINLSYTFNKCYSLTSLDLSGWSGEIAKSNYVFQNCSSLIDLDIHNLNAYGNTPNYWLKGCDNLTNFNCCYGISNEFNISYCPNLTVESIVSVLNGLYDFVGNGSTTTKKLTLLSAQADMLTDEQKAIATNKGWTLQLA